MNGSLVNLAPLARLLLLAALVALPLLAWWWWRGRRAGASARLAALTALTLFLTFDLIVFGSFTRLTDSGLGCPDWPGCYGEASPFGARADIGAAQAAQPTGPVTWTKAWIEMIHRYLAMTVGLLILVATVGSWWKRSQLPHSPWWPTLTLAWVIVQGLFGKYTVTLKLYPAIVTLHLMGGLILLLLLVLQRESFANRPIGVGPSAPSPDARGEAASAGPRLSRAAIGATLAIVLLQAALGGWVSSNYAVLACRGFPDCNGAWWPPMDFTQGFTLLRELGRAGHGGFLPFEALVAIHLVHRLFAVVATVALLALIAGLLRDGGAAARRFAALLGGLLLLQIASGLSNVVLDWPIAAALAHSAGAAALVGTLGALWARWQASPRGATASSAEWRPA